MAAAAVVSLAAPAGALPGPQLDREQAAVAYAAAHGVRSTIAVLDTSTGQYIAAGDDTALYPAASVVKVLVAAQLLATGQMTPANAALAYSMITRSDNEATDVLWPKAGGPNLMRLIESRYHLSIGTANVVRNYWGTTRITARGMAYLYRAVMADPRVFPWLYNAMSHAQRIAKNGDMQFFGIPAAVSSGFAIKQGWCMDNCTVDRRLAVFNSTGYVEDGRYIVVMLSTGPIGWYGAHPGTGPLATILSNEARTVIPGGHIDAPSDHDPIGHMDTAGASTDPVYNAHVAGWAFDPDYPAGEVAVSIFADGKFVDDARTGLPRPDINKLYHVNATAGWDSTFKIAPGVHKICAIILNNGPGTMKKANCITVTIPAPVAK